MERKQYFGSYMDLKDTIESPFSTITTFVNLGRSTAAWRSRTIDYKTQALNLFIFIMICKQIGAQRREASFRTLT